jgi:anthranilate synthase component 1
MVIKGQTAWLQAGAGIVADSDPDTEYQESVNKAAVVLRAISLAGTLRPAAPGGESSADKAGVGAESARTAGELA